MFSVAFNLALKYFGSANNRLWKVHSLYVAVRKLGYSPKSQCLACSTSSDICQYFCASVGFHRFWWMQRRRQTRTVFSRWAGAPGNCKQCWVPFRSIDDSHILHNSMSQPADKGSTWEFYSICPFGTGPNAVVVRLLTPKITWLQEEGSEK